MTATATRARSTVHPALGVVMVVVSGGVGIAETARTAGPGETAELPPT